MQKKRFRSKLALCLMAGAPLVGLAFAQTASATIVELKAADGNTIESHLTDPANTDIVFMKDKDGNPVAYKAGPAYSPKATCGQCHAYEDISKAYHFMNGALPGPDGMGTSDTWSSDNQDGATYKYLSNAYGHILSGGQFGAW